MLDGQSRGVGPCVQRSKISNTGPVKLDRTKVGRFKQAEGQESK